MKLTDRQYTMRDPNRNANGTVNNIAGSGVHMSQFCSIWYSTDGFK